MFKIGKKCDAHHRFIEIITRTNRISHDKTLLRPRKKTKKKKKKTKKRNDFLDRY